MDTQRTPDLTLLALEAYRAIRETTGSYECPFCKCTTEKEGPCDRCQDVIVRTTEGW